MIPVTTIPRLPERPEGGHKGTFGRVLIVAGSRGMSGAAALAGRAALRSGAGLVTVATPAGIQPIVAGLEPSYLTHGLPEDAGGRLAESAATEILELARGMDAVAIGPGWGLSEGTIALALQLQRELPQPLVVDADALNGLARGGAGNAGSGACPVAGPRVWTPHPGECARLLGTGVDAVEQDREQAAARLAERSGGVVLLKGLATVITDGSRLAINPTGNNGLATGGTGDVLTGLIAALLGQRLPAFDAAQLGAYVHGLAGDLAAVHWTRAGLIASDLPEALPQAWKQLGGG